MDFFDFYFGLSDVVPNNFTRSFSLRALSPHYGAGRKSLSA